MTIQSSNKLLRNMSTRIYGLAFVLAASVMFGLGAVLAKIVVSEINPIVVTFLDLVCGGILLSALILVKRDSLLPQFDRSCWIELVVLSVFGTAMPLLLIVLGLETTSAVKGGFLIQLQGLFAIGFAAIIMRERLTRNQVIGVVLLALGSWFVIVKEIDSAAWQGINEGDILVFVGAIGLGFGFILAKRLSKYLGSLQLSALRLILGSLALVPIIAVSAPVVNIADIAGTTIIILGLYIITNFCLAYIAIHEGLRLLKAWEVGAVIQSMPLFSTVFALVLLKDSVTSTQLMGGILAVLGGVMVASYGR
jgi:drug/metabolite transporter (DMT)-like permease